HAELPVRAPLELGVEGGDRRYRCMFQAEHVGAELDPGRAHIALLGLHQVQQRQQRGARFGVAAQDELRIGIEPFANLGGILTLVLGHQRSTPPMTGSIEATAMTTSATEPPSHMIDSACRLLNEGSRKWAR